MSKENKQAKPDKVKPAIVHMCDKCNPPIKRAPYPWESKIVVVNRP